MKFHDIILRRPRGEYISIYVICCLHIGHRGYDHAKAKDYLDYVLRTPDTYAIDLGDDIENALPSDEKHNSMMWDQVMLPSEQHRTACDLWTPLAEAGKLLATFDSNHWWRTEAKTGISMAEQLNIFLGEQAPKDKAPRWGRWQAMLRLHVGREMYVVHAQHGAGGGTTPEAALRKCRETASSHHADVYLRGHHHKKVVYEDLYFTWPLGKSQPEERKRAYGCTGCFMRWGESYAERAGLPPAVRGAIKLELSSRRHDVKISL